MCKRSLAARGVRSVRPSSRENRPNLALQRDEDDVARKGAILHRKSQCPAKKAKRARRSWAKKEREGERILRQFMH